MRHVLTPGTIDEAVAGMADERASALAGATWIMRAPIRGEALAGSYVALRSVPALRLIEWGASEIAIGAAVSHAELAAALERVAGCAGLVNAARQAANPAIREVATLGGNLCALAFPASDLAPAFIAAGAEVEIRDRSAIGRQPVKSFLAARATLPRGWLLTRVLAPRSDRLSAHARLPLRQAGDYPVAIVSVSVERTGKAPRIAVGSVEAVARRWPSLEQALEGRAIDAAAAAEAARERTGDFVGRDGVEAPGWYRTQVLPGLVRAAFASLQAQAR